MSFDWQTQEEISWDEPLPLEDEPIEPGPQRRWWLYVILVVVVGVATAVFVVIRELNRQVNNAEMEARLAVISSYNVIQQAALEGDAELFVGFLSGRDANWSAAQEQAVREGAYLERNGLGLQRLGEAGLAEETADVILSPDLTAAELTVTQTYAMDIGHGLTETVLLRQTAVYRLGPNRWLLAPPEPEFWGEMHTSNGRYLTTTYPERDAEIGRRLAADLDRKLIEMCEQIADLNCPPDLQVTLELTTNPNSLSSLNRTYIAAGQSSLNLPAPTLIGVPQDESSYRALQRGYARWIVAAVISNLVGWACCEHELFHQAIVEMQWQQLGLTALPPLAYEQVQANANRLEDILNLWNRPKDLTPPQEQQLVYTLIEFLTIEAGIPTPQLQREFGEITYRNWLLNVTRNRYPSFEDLDREWQRFLHERVISQVEVAYPLPDQDLQLLCQPHNQTNPDLVRYDTQTGAFIVEQHLHDTVSLLPLPDDRGVFLSGAGVTEPQIWQNGQAAVLPRQADLPPLTFDPEGHYLLLVDTLQPITPYLLLPLSQCLAGENCERRSLVGYPLWSPEGSQMALVGLNLSGSGRNDPFLFWAGGTEAKAELIGEGGLPFWLDETTLGYVTRREIISTLSSPDATPEIVILLEDLLAHLPTQGGFEETFIDFVTADPHNPQRLLIATADRLGRIARSHLFVYDRETEQMLVPHFFRDEPTDYERHYELSENGRWLTMTRFESDQNAWVLYLYNLPQNDITFITIDESFVPFPPRLFDWSADGRWLVITEKGAMRLIEPESGYEQLVIGAGMGCETAVWIN